MSGKKILVLGAGLAGLSATWHLQKAGIPCQVFEKEPEVGGLCRSRKVNGFTFDYDGHLLHFKSKETLELVRGLLKGNLAEHQRSAWIYSFGRFTPYPFQANLYGLPTSVVKECLEGFIEARGRGEAGKSGNFLQWMRRAFGDGIARHFMIPYNTKFWTVPPQRMTCDWLDGFIPLPTLAQVIEGSVEESRRQLGYNAHFWYPRQGGIGQLPRAFKEQIKDIHTGFEVSTIDLKTRKVFFTNGQEKGFDQLVSTIPLPDLAHRIKDVPQDIKAAFTKLRWNSIFNLNLGVRQKEPSEKHWIYFPQKDLSFFRAGFFHNFASDMAPHGTGSLYAEVSYSRNRPLDKKKIIDRIEADLKKAGLLAAGDEILCRDINDIQYGYPVYDRHYASARKDILAFLAERRVTSCGRYGGWRYMSMEDVILEGKTLADVIRSR